MKLGVARASRKRRRRFICLGQRRSGLRRLDLDDVAVQRPEQAEQLLLLRFGNAKLIERRHQVVPARRTLRP